MKDSPKKFFRWIDGRQDSGYKIMNLWFKWFDLVLIRYPLGSYIDWHTDPVPSRFEHHRINITVRRAIGGRFKTKGTACWEGVIGDSYYNKRVIRFRPDIQIHGVERVKAGERWVISIGWVRAKKAENVV